MDDGWFVVPETPAAELLVSLQQIHDPGEAEAIALAQQSEGVSLIIDERRGRSVAVHRKIKIIGTGGVLLEAKQRQYIDNVREPLLALVEAGRGIGYRRSFGNDCWLWRKKLLKETYFLIV